ncbi:exosome complex component RRP40 [Onthophagus taurus]|uniref:exosome complex component RRP40 n=1 Tax=Onthophagus taurus TaxID=166361 RepID=UPI000C20DD84|nr:exosome complex component RRP40 [Onthophagus taurus]
MDIKPGDFVMPGDTIKDISSIKNLVIIGPGLHQGNDVNTLIITRPGILCHKPHNIYWVETPHKRYIPKKGDLVVGVIVKKSGDALKVDIGSAEQAALSLLSFEGATKKQKPDLQVGDLVYAKLLSANKEMEPELVCIDKYYKAGNLGPLSSDGFLVNVLPEFVYKLLNVENPLLRTLGKKFPFEIAVGMNGKVWFNAKSTSDCLTLMRALLVAQHQKEKEIIEACNKR